jgi:hypothetical protein
MRLVEKFLDNTTSFIMDPSNKNRTPLNKGLAWGLTIFMGVGTVGIAHGLSAGWRKLRHIDKNDTHDMISELFQRLFLKNNKNSNSQQIIIIPILNQEEHPPFIQNPNPITINSLQELEIQEEYKSLEIKKATEQQLKIQSWIEQYGSNYVAHAIEPVNVQKVMESGELRCAEEVLRTSKEIEYEQGASTRGTSQLPEIDQEDVKSYFNFDKEVTQLNKKINKKKEKARQANQDLDVKCYLNVKRLKNLMRGFNFIIIPDTNPPDDEDDEEVNEGSAELTGQTFFKVKKISDRPDDKMQGFTQKYKCRENILGIALDEAAQTKVDVYLTKKFKKMIEKGANRQHARWIAYEARNLQLHGPTKLNPEIRFLKNKIAWAYGDVAILKGFLNEASLKENLDTISDGLEVITHRPYENEGVFQTLNLSEEDTIIIGPKKVLNTYEGKVKAKFFAVEDLTDEQKTFFNIPLL